MACRFAPARARRSARELRFATRPGALSGVCADWRGHDRKHARGAPAGCSRCSALLFAEVQLAGVDELAVVLHVFEQRELVETKRHALDIELLRLVCG